MELIGEQSDWPLPHSLTTKPRFTWKWFAIEYCQWQRSESRGQCWQGSWNRDVHACWVWGFLARGFLSSNLEASYNICREEKRLSVGGRDIVDPEAIYNLVLGLLVSQRDVNLQDVFATELIVYPTSMFDSDGTIRISTGKNSLKKNMQVEIVQRNMKTPSVIVVDVSAVIWTLQWP